MNATPSVSTTPGPQVSATPVFVRPFHAALALILIALMLWGFHHFYFEGRSYPGRDITPPIRSLVIAHGASMAGWMVLYLVQTFLIATRNRRVHMALGKVGAVLALGILAIGYMVAVGSAKVSPPEMQIWGMHPDAFMIVPMATLALFGGFVATGVANRRRAEMHRAMMLLGTIAALGAALSRIDAFTSLYVGTIWEKLFGPFFGSVVLAVIVLLARWAVTRKFDRPFAWGTLIMTAFLGICMQVATTPAWLGIAHFLMR